jgi:2-oxoglutarate ferredoxin oxidoreductase subunit delta
MSEQASTTATPQESPVKEPRRPGLTVINQERCKGCGFCVEFCPSHNLTMSKKFNPKGYHYPEVGDQNQCKGCDLCGMLCPDFAIYGTRK